MRDTSCETMSKFNQMTLAVALGEHQYDFERLAAEVLAQVEATNHDPAAMSRALDYLTAAAAVLKAGLFTISGGEM